jgi:hypothetical protein
MTLYRFTATRGPDEPIGFIEVAVQFDNTSDETLDPVVGAFVMFLKGLNFEPGSIRKYIDHEMV